MREKFRRNLERELVTKILKDWKYPPPTGLTSKYLYEFQNPLFGFSIRYRQISRNHKQIKPGISLYFYYFWKTDNKLYKLKYDTKLFDTFRKEYPFFNRNQEHFYIPADDWDYIGVVDLENCCLKVIVE